MGDGGVREDGEREGTGEPDEVFAAGDSCEKVSELVHRFQGLQGAVLGVLSGLNDFSLLYVDDKLGDVGTADAGQHLGGSWGATVADIVVIAGAVAEDDGGARGDAIDHGLEEGEVGGKALQHGQAIVEDEDGDACTSRRIAEKFAQLVLHIGLVLHLGVEGIEQKDVDGAVGWYRCEVGEDAGRKVWRGDRFLS